MKYALWTGGWDSTFMLIQLLKNKDVVQPIYIIDDKRASVEYEKRAMSKIINAMEKHDFWGGKLLPIDFVSVAEIPDDKIITEAWKRLNKATLLGTQHEWIARYATWKKHNLCLGHEKGVSPNGHLTKTLNNYTKLKTNKENYLVLDKKTSTKDGWIILGKMIFPIMNYTETDMVKTVKQWKVEDVMRHVWFCHTPTKKGKPCGKCHPCIIKLNSNMFFLLPRRIVYKYKFHKFIDKYNNKTDS